MGQVIDFRLEVFLKECPEKGKSLNQTIQVYPVGLSESVFIDLEMLCSCPCEKPGDVVSNNSKRSLILQMDKIHYGYQQEIFK